MKYIPHEAWNDLKKKYISDDITDFAQGLVTSLIILVPEAKIAEFKKSSKFHELREEYYNLVRQHTEKIISGPESIVMNVESKEEFDRRCQGSWYNAFR